MKSKLFLFSMILFNFTSHYVSSYSNAPAIKTVSEQQSGEAPASTGISIPVTHDIIYKYIHIKTDI